MLLLYTFSTIGQNNIIQVAPGSYCVEGSNLYFYAIYEPVPPVTYSWAFEGGVPSTSSNNSAIVNYSTYGNYNVTLIITDANGTQTFEKINFIHVAKETTVYTPNNSSVTAYIFIEWWSSEEIDQKNQEFISNYPEAVFIGDASNLYNCHAYAWHITEGHPNDKVWIEDPGDNTYWEDGSYISTTSDLATKISYSGDDHSAISTNDTEWFISKWGSGPTMKHKWNYGPSDYNPNGGLAYYKKNLDANFTANQTSVIAGSSVQFTDQSTGSPTSWSWSFSGGTPSSSSLQNPTITYNTAGSYNVSLTVTIASNSDTETKTNYITVNPPAASANFSGCATITTGQTVQFTDQSTNSPTSWSWTFQGGTPSVSTLQNPSVTYYTAGNYNVTLTASNITGGSTASINDCIHVGYADIKISGNVKDGNFNSNLAGITVQANYDDGSLANSAITDDNGNFEFFVDYYWTGDVIALGGSSYGNQSIHLTEVISNKNLQFYLYGVSLSILKTQLSGNYYEFKAIGAPIYTESYTWNFGDGSFPETSSLWWRNYYYSCSQTLTYNYTVTLSILTESGQTFNASLPVTIEPCPAVTSGVYYGDECSTFRMGSTATILDLSSPFSDINYLGIWWGEGDVEYWDTESGSQHGTNPEHFMYIANCREFEHLFNSAGHYNVSLTAYNSAEQGNAIYLGFNIVDCSVQITNSYLWGSVIDHWNNAYYEWAGSYNLSTFDPRLYSIGFPSILDENIYVGACDEIVLNDGVTIEPAVGKEIVFYIDECLQGSDNKNMQIADNDRPQHETKCLTSEEHENIIQNYNNDVIIYPNPNNGIFMLSFTNPGTKIKQLEIFNSLGQLILKNNNIVKHNYLVDISRNNCGIYYVKILYENKTDIFKVAYSIIN